MEEYHIDRFWNSVMNSKELFITSSETNAKERGFDNFFIVENEHGLTIRDNVHLKHRIREGEVNVVVIDDGVDLDDIDRDMLSDVGVRQFFIKNDEIVDEYGLRASHYINSVVTGVMGSPFVDSDLFGGVFSNEIDESSNIIHCSISLTDDVFNEGCSVNGLVVIANTNLDEFVKENGKFLDPATTPYIVLYSEDTGFNLYDIVTKEIHPSSERLETAMRTLGFTPRKDTRESEVIKNIEGFKKYVEDFKSKKTLLVCDDSEVDHSRMINDLGYSNDVFYTNSLTLRPTGFKNIIASYDHDLDLIIITDELYNNLRSDVKDYLFELSKEVKISTVKVYDHYNKRSFRYKFNKLDGSTDINLSDDTTRSILRRGRDVFVEIDLPEHIVPESDVIDKYYIDEVYSSANGIVIVPSIKAGEYSNICKEEVPYLVVYCEPDLGIYNRSTKKAYYNDTITNMLAELNLCDKVVELEPIINFGADDIDYSELADESVSKHNEDYYDKMLFHMLSGSYLRRPSEVVLKKYDDCDKIASNSINYSRSPKLLEILRTFRKITSTSKIDTKRKRYKLKIYT